MALLVSMIALSVFSLVGMYMTFNAMTDLRISDNYESQVQARYAAQAGLSHAREILRGLNFNDLLTGPDGTASGSSSYLTTARAVSYRNPVHWNMGRSLNIANPASDLAAVPDDGIMNTGKLGTTNGVPLIPLIGIPQTATNLNDSVGTVTLSRYFVKVTDNNGEGPELAADPGNNPFVDGDGTIVVRSMGVSRTIREGTGAGARANSVAVFEARFRKRNAFNMDAPVVIQGDSVLPAAPNMFDGNAFTIDGGNNNFGIATIDTDPNGAPVPSQITSQLAQGQRNNIKGMGGSPSVSDITGSVTTDPDKAHLLDPVYLYHFATTIVPQYADNVYNSNQSWSGGSAPDIGYYDVTKPANHPSQRPKITYVNGDLDVSGNLDGGGVLVIRGELKGSGRFTFNGLILVIGKGVVNMSGMNMGLNGGLYVVNVTDNNGTPVFGTPKFTISGNSDIKVNANAMNMSVSMLPAVQISWREITSMMDP